MHWIPACFRREGWRGRGLSRPRHEGKPFIWKEEDSGSGSGSGIEAHVIQMKANQLPTWRRRGVRRRWEMAFVPLQAPKVNPTAATDQGAGGEKEDKARQHTDPSPIIFSPPTRRPARKGNRGVGAKPIEDVPPSRVLLGCPPSSNAPQLARWTGQQGTDGTVEGSWERRRRRRVGPSWLGPESLGPARAAGQLIKTSPSPQSSAWPGNCLLPPFSNLSIPFVLRRVCSLPCFLEHILYCRRRWPTPHALQRLSLISVQSGDGLRRPRHALHLSVVAIDWSLC